MPGLPTDEFLRERRLAFGDRLRQARGRKSMTQEDLAKAAGLDRKTVNRIERGIHSIRLDNVWAIADALGVSAGDLVSGVTESVA